MTKRQKITAKKKHISPTNLCKNAPDQLRDILLMSMTLGFSEKPNYVGMKCLLAKMTNPKLVNAPLDWMTCESMRKAAGLRRNVEIDTELKPRQTTKGENFLKTSKN